MTLTDNLSRQLSGDEGRVPHAYQDHLGFWTIGIGRLVDQRKGGKLSDVEIDFLFNNDLFERLSKLSARLPWIHKLDDARKGVLINMSFQMGVDGLLEFHNTLRMVQAGDYAGAAQGMLQSKWAREQTPARALRLSKQMSTGVWHFTKGT